MSNSFVNSQLFSNNQKKDSIIKLNFHQYGYYATVLDGKISYSEWQKLSPKEKELAIESQEDIRKIQNETFKNLTPPQNKKEKNIQLE